ncbi:hypothetical protein JD844_024397 [Phrynosoma platyrhinos]|uniref:Transcription cofactor vestigial-like protein 2 n=1 Tax=Phrynosoma platyrhinos TaxID=52577 RepID=A0ABQ7SXS1_PHRPL|nr:hypothetical protein JD844_024397 [Phrynosoma platyrhinos]
MQEAAESASSASTSGSGSASSASSSFSSHTAPASIKEEECSPEKERPPEAEYISSRCVLFTYFQGDISAVVDEHFSRALSQPSSYSPSSTSTKATTAARSTSSWRGEPIGFSFMSDPCGGVSLSTALGNHCLSLPLEQDLVGAGGRVASVSAA